jgi:hypothetical protein
MMMRSWIRKLIARPVAHPIRKRPHRARLAVEALEQRCVPTFTVTNLLDDGSVGSLRWAVGQANMTGGDETIDFDPTVFATPQTITLAGNQLELTDTTGTETITGPAAGVTVDGGGQSRVFQIDGRVAASISGLTISGGFTTGNGGGLANLGGTLTLSACTVSGNSCTVNILNNGGGGVFSMGGTTTLTNCTLSGNSAVPGDGGGVFSMGGTTTLTNCTLSGNSAVRGDGGGLFAIGGTTVTLTNCTVSGNSGSTSGGLINYQSTMNVTDCTVSGNSALLVGGLENYQGTMNVTDCTVSGNSGSSGGGLCNSEGRLTLTDCTVSGNSSDSVGGGLDSVRGTTTLTHCAVSGNNSARLGGGLDVCGGGLTLTNCTVSGNSATLDGGGLYTIRGTNTLTDCTVSGNSAGGHGGGLLVTVQGASFLHNTLIAGNVSGATGMTRDDVDGRLDPASDYNLIGDGTGMTGISNGVNGNLVGSAAAPIDPRLDALGDNGGPTQTMRLLPGSPALDAGAPDQLGSTDQRGVVRTGGVNIGAYQASATAFLVSAPRRVHRGVPFDVTVTAEDPFGQVAAGYTGTVTFSTSDPSPRVVLPADYPFTLDDGGTHTFTDTGLGETTLRRPGRQTLTVTDTADASLTGQASVRVRRSRPGPAPAPAHGAVSAAPVAGDLVWLPAWSIHHGAGESRSGSGWEWLDGVDIWTG